MGTKPDNPRTRVPPPLFVLVFILIGVGLQRVHPLYFVSGTLRLLFSILFICGGLGLVVPCAVTFKRAKTGIRPWEATTRIVTTGFYRFSRNPIYCGFILVGLGIAFSANNLWIALLQIPNFFVLDKFIIQKEEIYLEEKFGEEYRAYQKKVRRWI